LSHRALTWLTKLLTGSATSLSLPTPDLLFLSYSPH
jgi:hypothetical protein